MKRKWLIAIASLAMAISFVLGVSACAPKEGGKSDEEIAQAAINTLNSLYIKDGEVKNYETPDKYTVLGKVNVDDELYTVTWTAAAKTDGVNIADYVTVGEIDSKNQVEIGIKRATVDVEYTLTASVTVGKATKTADYGHKIPKKSSEEAVTASLDLTDRANRTKIDTDNNEQVWQQNGITLTNTSNVADYVPIRLYQNTPVSIEMENARIIHIDFHSAQGYTDSPYPEHLLTSLQNSDLPIKGDIALAEDGLTISVDFETPQEVVTFRTTAGQCRLTSIDVEAIERDPDEHVHNWTYEHVANTWTHTATCTAEGCDVKTKTENCEPKLNVCGCGYTYSAKEIVDALFALEKDQSLPGTYSLTGVVTNVEEVDTAKYKNATFDMEVEGRTVKAYRVKGSHYSEVAVGGTATVTGTLLDYNGTKEFTQGGSVVAFTPGVDERTADEKAEAALAKVAETLTIAATGTQTLATSSEREVTFAWAVKSGDSLPDGITLADGKLSVTKLPEEEKSFQLVVTATIAEATQTHTKTVTVTVKSQGTQPQPSGELTLTTETLFAGISGTGYSPYQGDHNVNGATVTTNNVLATDNYYDGSSNLPFGFTVMQFSGSGSRTAGVLSLKGTFTKIVVVIATSYDYDQADKLTITAGTTTLTAGNHTEADANFSAKGSAWKFHTIEYDVTTTGEQTITFTGATRAVYVKSITLTGSASGGGAVDPDPQPTEGFQHITEPTVGTYVMGMQVEDTIYYLKGGMDGYYLATSSNPADAVEVTLVASGSDYVIKCGTQFIEVEASGTHINAVYKDAQTAGKVWKWNAEHELFTMEVNGSTYYLGTYWKDGYNYPYNTIGASDFSYYSETKQYHARLGKIGTSAGGGEEPPAEDEILYTLSTTTEKGSNNNYASNCDVELDGVTWNVEGNSTELPWRFGGKSIAATDRKLSGKTAIKGTVKQVIITFGPATITVNSITFNVFQTDPTVAGAAATFTKTVEHSANGTVTVEAPDAGWTDCFYQIVFNVTNSATSNKYVSVNTIEFRSTVKTDVDKPDPEPEPEGPFKPIKTPAAAINYYMGMKTQDGKYHYITGAMTGYYMATTTDIAQAKRVTLSGSDTDGWTIMCEGKYIEIAISGSHINAVYSTSQTSGRVWKWDSQYNIFTMEISGVKYFLGTYGSNTTVGGGNYSSYVATNYLAVLGLYGDETAQAPSDEGYAQQILDSLTIPSATLNKVGASLTLPTSTAHGATVVWTATGENASLVTIEGTKLSVAKVPQTETTVTLHCVVTINDASVEKDFTVTVRDLNDKEKADAVVTALNNEFKTADKYFWTLDKAVTLPTENDYSATVVWTLEEAGKEWMKLENNKLSVLKLYEAPNYGKTTIKLTLTVTVGEEVSTKEYSLTLYAEDTFTAETSAPEYGYYFIEAKNPTTGERTIANGKVSGSNGVKGSNLQHHTADSEAGLFLLVPVPNQENSYWLKFPNSSNRSLKDYLGITVLSNGVALNWSSSWNSNSETTTKSSIWHWDDERDVLYVTIAEKNYVLGTTYAQTITPIAMEDAIKNTSYWWAKIGSISTRQADLDNVPPQATSVEFYTVKGKKLADGAEIALKAEFGWGALVYYKVLPEGADQKLSISSSEAYKLNNSVGNDQLDGVTIAVGSQGAAGDELTVTFTVVDTEITFTLKVKIVENVTVIKGETPENSISIDVLYNRVKRADDAYPGARVQAGYNRPYYVTGRLHKAEDGTYYLQDDDGKQIKLSTHFNFKGEAAGLTVNDLVEGEVVTLGAKWNLVQEGDAKVLASYNVCTVFKANVETDDEKVRNVQGRLDVDFTPITGIDAVGKFVDLTEMANKAMAGEYGVTVNWAVTAPTDASTYLEIKDNKLTALKLPEKSTTFTLTATISKEGIETPLTKTFSFKMSTTADVDIAKVAAALTIDFSGLQKAGDTIDLKAVETAAIGDTKVTISWSIPVNSYWTTKVIDGKTCLVVTEMPKEAMTFTFTASVRCTNGTSVSVPFTFTLGPAA